MDALLQSRAQELAKEFAGQATTVEELNKLLRLMMKSGLEQMLDTELDVHLGRRPAPAAEKLAALASEAPPTDGKKRPSNRRNGRSKKTVQGDLGEVTLSTPRDRNGPFEPLLIEKHQRRVPGFDEKILALYAKGMTTRDIQEIVQELYGVEVSATLVSEITADLDAEANVHATLPQQLRDFVLMEIEQQLSRDRVHVLLADLHADIGAHHRVGVRVIVRALSRAQASLERRSPGRQHQLIPITSCPPLSCQTPGFGRAFVFWPCLRPPCG